MKTKEQHRVDICHPKQFVFPLRWWKSIQTLSIEEQKVICFSLVAYIFDHVPPGIQFGEADEVWHTIANDIAKNQRKSQKRASGRLEKEQIIDKEEVLSALSPEEKEIVKEKESRVREFELALRTKYPNVASMQVPLSFDEYLKLLKKWPNSLIKTVMLQMNDWPDIHKNETTYHTCLCWLEKRKKKIIELNRWHPFEVEIQKQKSFVERYMSVGILKNK